MPSDPLRYTCTCSGSLPAASPSHQPGLVLLFYRYFTSPPSLPPPYHPLALTPTSPFSLQSLHHFQTSTCQTLGLTGKIRVSSEGFNITVAGPTSSINSYIASCISHWSFSGLNLSLEEEQEIKDFFKPTPGCACVFEGLNVRVADEITPLGLTNYSPKDWNSVIYLDPEQFHDMVTQPSEEGGGREGGGERVLLDIRNHYESRIGYFLSPSSDVPTIRPQIRRFSQFPAFVKKHMASPSQADKSGGKTIISYCTGGIRCEKATRWISENVEQTPQDKIYTLKGGITAYMAWFEQEVREGRRKKGECLWRGREYVFDARGSLGLGGVSEDGGNMHEREKIAVCHGCGKAEDRLGKCGMGGCELVLVVCEGCEGLKCCKDCGDIDEKGKRQICSCEREREFGLWGADGMKGVQVKTRKNGKTDKEKNRINIKVQVMD